MLQYLFYCSYDPSFNTGSPLRRFLCPSHMPHPVLLSVLPVSTPGISSTLMARAAPLEGWRQKTNLGWICHQDNSKALL